MTNRIVLVSTGGTIEKTYDARTGDLANRTSVLDHMLSQLELPDTVIERVTLMNKDSLTMTQADHDLIATRTTGLASEPDTTGVVVVHGTDRLAESGEATFREGPPRSPIVFTGAMRPYALRQSDALQNLTEALLATILVAPGVYVVMQGRVLEFPGVRKDTEALRFVKSEPAPTPPTEA